MISTLAKQGGRRYLQLRNALVSVFSFRPIGTTSPFVPPVAALVRSERHSSMTARPYTSSLSITKYDSGMTARPYTSSLEL